MKHSVCHAVFDAVGVRLRSVPFKPAIVRAALQSVNVTICARRGRCREHHSQRVGLKQYFVKHDQIATRELPEEL